MLQMVGYELARANQEAALRTAIRKKHGNGIKIARGPWFIGTDRQTGETVASIRKYLKKRKITDEKLLAVQVHMGEVSTAGHPVSEPMPPGKINVHAIVCSLGDAKRRPKLLAAIGKLGTSCHPFESLWFVQSNKKAHALHKALVKNAGLQADDELAVIRVDKFRSGKAYKLKRKDRDWLKKHKVLPS